MELSWEAEVIKNIISYFSDFFIDTIGIYIDAVCDEFAICLMALHPISKHRNTREIFLD